MSEVFFLKYKTAGGYDAFFNPDCISHIYPATGFAVVVMRNGHEFTFDSTVDDFIKRMSMDISAQVKRNIF